MNLFSRLNELVLPTTQTRKITINGKTKIYPVYKVRLDAVYYNDQNDRIASYVSQYKNENGNDVFETMDNNEYNSVIEKFIVYSNPQSIEKTQNNIRLVGQREAGVILQDGRIIDGNRRYTCLRRINKDDPEVNWFETVILDMDINDSKKLIKMLELTIQHGEEKKVDYNRVELLIGVYQDIVETGLLTIEEYASSINESIAEVKRRVESSKLLMDFLEYIGMPKQYHVAREYQIVSLINDLQEILRRIKSIDDVRKIKTATFMNFMMGSFTDERKFIKDINTMLQNNEFEYYFEEQEEIEELLNRRLKIQRPSTLSELKAFVRGNDDIVDMLKDSLEKNSNGAKVKEIKKQPSLILNKSVNNLKDIDLNIIQKLDDTQKEELVEKVKVINKMVNMIEDIAVDGKPMEKAKPEPRIIADTKPVIEAPKVARPYLKATEINDQIHITKIPSTLTNLIFSAWLYKDGEEKTIKATVLDDEYRVCSNEVVEKLGSEAIKISFELNSSLSKSKSCYLCIRYADDEDTEARYMYLLKIDIIFDTGFDF